MDEREIIYWECFVDYIQNIDIDDITELLAEHPDNESGEIEDGDTAMLRTILGHIEEFCELKGRPLKLWQSEKRD